jgi:hypothetical protein
MGVETTEGTLRYHQEAFEHPFEVVAGNDPVDQAWLGSAFNNVGLGLLLVFVILIVAYSFSTRKRRTH